MLRGILTVGGWTLISRITGFGRDMLVAALMGAGPVADAFFVALKLPNLFRRLFGEGAFNAAFVPAFSAALAAEGRDDARALADRMLGLLTVWLLALTAAGWLAMPLLLFVLANGFVGDPVRWPLTVEMTRITFPYLVLICVTALISGVLNGLGRFAAAAAAPVLFNLCAIASLWLLRPFTDTPGHALAWGVTLSGGLQLALVWWAAARAGMRLVPRVTVPDAKVKAVLRRMVPGVVGAGATQLNLVLDVLITSFLPAGSIAYLYYADRLAQLPLGVIGAAVGTALLPLLSRQFSTGQPLSAHRTLNRAVEFSLVLVLPAAAALMVCAVPLVDALFRRGAFDDAAAAATAAALVAYAAGLPAFVLVKTFAPGFFARGDTRTPVQVGLFTVALNLVLNLILIRFLDHVGVALATAISAWVNLALLAGLLARQGAFRADRRLRRRVPRMLAATAIMAAVLAAATWWLFPAEALRLPRLALLIGLGMASYFGAAQLLGAMEWRDLRGLRRRKG